MFEFVHEIQGEKRRCAYAPNTYGQIYLWVDSKQNWEPWSRVDSLAAQSFIVSLIDRATKSDELAAVTLDMYQKTRRQAGIRGAQVRHYKKENARLWKMVERLLKLPAAALSNISDVLQPIIKYMTRDGGGVRVLSIRDSDRMANNYAQLVDELKRYREALEDFTKHGLRFDLNPAHEMDDEQTIEVFWHGYIKRADASIRERAARALGIGDDVATECDAEEIPEYASVMPLAEFVACVASNAFTDYDGHGNFCKNNLMYDGISPSNFNLEAAQAKGYTHVAWFNR